MRLLMVLALLCGACLTTLVAAEVDPTRVTGRQALRVEDRRERIDLQFPPEQQWAQVDHQARGGVESRVFETAERKLTGGLDLATITIIHHTWDANLDMMQKMFRQQIFAECIGIEGDVWHASEDSPRSRVVVYTCEESTPPFSALQLLMQGQDHFFCVELYSTDELLPEGQLVRWAEFLKGIRPCLLDDPENLCPSTIWR